MHMVYKLPYLGCSRLRKGQRTVGIILIVCEEESRCNFLDNFIRDISRHPISDDDTPTTTLSRLVFYWRAHRIIYFPFIIIYLSYHKVLHSRFDALPYRVPYACQSPGACTELRTSIFFHPRQVSRVKRGVRQAPPFCSSHLTLLLL